MVFIGFLIGGAVPFLFSSMLIRAVGRAAFLIVRSAATSPRRRHLEWHEEARLWPRRRHLHLYGQKELIGRIPRDSDTHRVGFLLGTQALGGFLAGMIVVGQLLAVFWQTPAAPGTMPRR